MREIAIDSEYGIQARNYGYTPKGLDCRRDQSSNRSGGRSDDGGGGRGGWSQHIGRGSVRKVGKGEQRKDITRRR